jgi:hypothetical protein
MIQHLDTKKTSRLDYSFFEQLLPDDRLWYTVKEVAVILGRSPQYVRDCFENQKLLGHICNAKAMRGSEQRYSYLIPRQSLILFLMETANYGAGEFLKRYKQVEEQLSQWDDPNDAQRDDHVDSVFDQEWMGNKKR